MPMLTVALIIAGYLVVMLPIASFIGRFCGVADRSMGIDQEGRW